jgi:tRNA-dihydrouridine synthase
MCSSNRETYEFIKRAESVGVEYITVHGRTKTQKNTEPANLDAIRFVKESASVPIIANGGIFSMTDVEEIYAKTNVDGVMSARGLLRNPALFAGYEYTPWECIEVKMSYCNELTLPTLTEIDSFIYCRNMSIWQLDMAPITLSSTIT